VTLPDEVVVSCEDVCRSFGRGRSEVVAVRDVSCQVRRGQRVALTGESGSGKTTLLHLMAGLDTPTTGSVTWPALERRGDRPLGIGVVFQTPSLLPALDVTENVELPLLLADVPAEEARHRALAALDRLDLSGLAAAAPDELSGGQSQRVALARVLASEPAVVLADEPTGRLDRRTAEHVLDVLMETVEVLGAALVVTTHDPAVSGRVPERWAMVDGRLAEPATKGARR
jgi:ABC-type lipoprotein export system ATPase subunit